MPETAPPYPLVIHIDGASRGNPGPAAYAVVVKTPDGQPVASFAKKLGTTTNNFAEYQALLAALRYATGSEGRRVSVISDSELLVRQIQGRYKVKSEDLKPLYDEALKLIRQLDSFSIAHVLREKNREADRLANMALDGHAMEEPPAQSKPPARPAPQIPQTPAPKAKVESHPPVKAEVPPLAALTEEESMLRDAAYEFAANEIAPNAREMDRDGVFKKSLLDQFFAQGFMGVGVPEAYGGSGGTFFMSILAVEEFARVDASASVIIDVQNTLVENAILRWGTEEQKKSFLPRLAKDTVGAYALSEAQSGSDAFALETRAKDEGTHFVLNGRKLWITNAQEAGLFIVFATVDRALAHRGITAFMVERNTPGFSVGKKEDKLGIRASSTCELLLEDCRVPRTNVLGEVGQGYKVAIETLNEGRIGIAAQMAGIARGALDHAIAYAKERRQFGKPLAAFQAIQFQIARLATEVEAARLMTYNAARLKDAGLPFTREAAMAKYFASQVAERAASEAVEIFGGCGYTKDYPAEKYLRDAKIGKIYEGTSFMQLQTIAKILLGDSNTEKPKL
ncbi:MAG TPA: acyl-CoA dehydrogenase family protein [Terriglobia bacterium]|nr:acyl-CoA dehydrogenase family protein [Terriglobia bacterium]